MEGTITSSATAAVESIRDLLQRRKPLAALEALKFTQVGRDPLDPDRALNLVEQLNQTFTYLVSIRAVEYLFRKHPEAGPYRVNLGTQAGSDVESLDGSVAAEVFAAVHPASNRKLAKDVAKVAATAARHRYVFFHCPGDYARTDQNGVVVIPLSLSREA